MNARASLLLLMTFLAGLPSSPAWAQDTIDILEQDVFVDLSSPEPRIELSARIEVLEPSEGMWLVNPGLPVESISVNGQTATVTPNAYYPTLVSDVYFPPDALPGTEVVLDVNLGGPMRCAGRGGIVCLFTDTESVLVPSFESSWYIQNIFVSDPFMGTIQVRAPSDQRVVAGQGDARSVVEEGAATKLWTFGIDTPSELLSVYSGVAEVRESTVGFPVSVVFRGDASTADRAEHAAELASSILDYYGQIYEPLSMSRAHVVSIPPGFPFGGMGMLGTTFVTNSIFGPLDFMLDQGVAHEFAHTWWGNMASSGERESMAFFSEALAEYSAWRALGEIFGEDTRTAGVRMNALWYMFRRPGLADPAIVSAEAETSPAMVHVTYHKGSTVLRTFAEAVGEERFTEALRRFFARGAGGLGVAALVEDIAMVSGVDTQILVDQWLENAGYPRLTVERAVQSDSDTEIALVVSVSGAFDLRLPIRLRRSTGEVVEHVAEVSEGRNELRLPRVEELVAVEIDPRWTLVRQVTPAVREDLTLDGRVDGADLIEAALALGAAMPTERRRVGSYDPLVDVNSDFVVDGADLAAILARAGP